MLELFPIKLKMRLIGVVCFFVNKCVVVFLC